jgi:hypothetical protein
MPIGTEVNLMATGQRASSSGGNAYPDLALNDTQTDIFTQVRTD